MERKRSNNSSDECNIAERMKPLTTRINSNDLEYINQFLTNQMLIFVLVFFQNYIINYIKKLY